MSKTNQKAETLFAEGPAEARKAFAAIRKRGSITVVDLEEGRATAALAEFGPAGAKVVRRASCEVIPAGGAPWTDAKAVGTALGAALAEARMKGPQAAFLIPRGAVVLKPLVLPFLPDVAELAAMVRLQVARDLPFRVEDAVVDFKFLRWVEAAGSPAEGGAKGGAESAPTRRVELLVGVARADHLQFLKNVAQAAGLKLVSLPLRQHGLARALVAGEEMPEGESALVISLRKDEATLDVAAGSLLAFSRLAPVKPPAGGGKPAPEAAGPEADPARFVAALGTEAVRCVASFDGLMWKRPVRRIAVVGSTGLEGAVVEALQLKTGLPTAMLTFNAGGPKGGEAAGHDPAAAGAAIALGDPSGPPIDFLNPKRPLVKRDTRRLKILAAAAAAAVFFVGLGVARHRMVGQRTLARDAAQLELNKASQNLATYRKLQSQARVVSTWGMEGRNWMDHMALLTSLLPGAESIYLSSLATTSQGVIRMALQAKSSEVIVELDKQLRAAGYEVRPLSITPGNDKHGYPFRTTVELLIPRGFKFKPQLAPPPARPADDTPVALGAQPGPALASTGVK